jgi:geranyl-CoA carboxylase alpha subunit
VSGFDSLLIANRGEIAIRIARTARARGLRTIAVVSDADRAAPHARACDDVVAIGGERPVDSYLRIDKLIAAARRSGAQAVHPGYGFLAENAAFAHACADAGLVFVGPPASAIAAMGDKAAARQRAAALGIPVLAGYDQPAQDLETLRRAASLIGFPVMIKASAGGGGRGMRRVDDAAHFDAAVASARSEAAAAFGDDRLVIERALRAPRHVEIQVFADRHGRRVFLGERDCSVQRRHQKIVEEAPCPVLSGETRRAMGAAALRLVEAIGYVGAGTVEFLHAGAEFYFMEMNTRLQVEHPVTEALTGLDLVDLQFSVAMGEPLALDQAAVLATFESNGHAIEVRLCAEDPGAGFLPRSGRIEHWQAPEGIRCDHAVEANLAVSPLYDSLLGKAIALGATRADAARRLAQALDRTVVLGVATNRAFLARLLRHPAFGGDEVSTAFIDTFFATDAARASWPTDAHWALAALITTRHADAAWPPEWHGWSSNCVQATPFHLRAGDELRRGRVEGVGALSATVHGERPVPIELATPLSAGRWSTATVDGRALAFCFARAGDALWLQVEGIDIAFTDLRMRPPERARHAAGAGAVTAAMHGRVVAVAVVQGDRVERGAVLATLEAMKMEHALAAPAAGRVRVVHVRAGEQVAAGAVVIEVDLDLDADGARGMAQQE